jgi:hypothetical protein
MVAVSTAGRPRADAATLGESLDEVLSEYSVMTDGSRTARRPTIAAVISMRFEVVTASPPLNSSIISPSTKITAAYPPAPPGCFRHEPSVSIV